MSGPCRAGGGDLLERALLALGTSPPPPPPPPFARVLARIDATDAALRPRGLAARPLAWLAAAGAGLAAAAIVVIASRPHDAARSPAFTVVAGAEQLRWTGERDFVATGPAKLVSPCAEVTVEAGAKVSLGSDRAVDVAEGRASFHVTHPRQDDPREPRFRVVAGLVHVLDRGTTFHVDVTAAGTDGRATGRRTLVTVTEGSVTANGVDIEPGKGLAFIDGRPNGAAWSLDARPTLSLEAAATEVAAGDAFVLRVALENPTDGWIPWPQTGTASSPLHVEVTDPAGAVSVVRVTDSMLVGGPASAQSIPPRGKSVLPVRFDRTFASPGTYRLRAIFRPADAVESPTSAPLSLSVRAAPTPTPEHPR